MLGHIMPKEFVPSVVYAQLYMTHARNTAQAVVPICSCMNRPAFRIAQQVLSTTLRLRFVKDATQNATPAQELHTAAVSLAPAPED